MRVSVGKPDRKALTVIGLILAAAALTTGLSLFAQPLVVLAPLLVVAAAIVAPNAGVCPLLRSFGPSTCKVSE